MEEGILSMTKKQKKTKKQKTLFFAKGEKKLVSFLMKPQHP
jgi:hypothetical protein